MHVTETNPGRIYEHQGIPYLRLRKYGPDDRYPFVNLGDYSRTDLDGSVIVHLTSGHITYRSDDDGMHTIDTVTTLDQLADLLSRCGRRDLVADLDAARLIIQAVDTIVKSRGI